MIARVDRGGSILINKKTIDKDGWKKRIKQVSVPVGKKTCYRPKGTMKDRSHLFNKITAVSCCHDVPVVEGFSHNGTAGFSL